MQSPSRKEMATRPQSTYIFGAVVLMLIKQVYSMGPEALDVNIVHNHKIQQINVMSTKKLNARSNVSSYKLYPVLMQQTNCQQLYNTRRDQIQPLSQKKILSSQVCADDACLVEAMYAKISIIVIANDVDISNSLPLPTIITTMTIRGTCIDHPCIIDALGAGQIFFVGSGGFLTLHNLEIRGGYDKGGGAAILVARSIESSTSGKLLALNVLFFNNVAGRNGGAILVKEGGTVYIQNSVFDSNEATKGGAIYIQSSDDIDTNNLDCNPSSCATFVNIVFKSNWADYGGAVYVNEAFNCLEPGKFECTTCSFEENSAIVDGGAIYLARSKRGAKGIVKHSIFFNNKVATASKMTGGAVSIQAGEPGTVGEQFNSYMSTYAQTYDNEIAVSVKAYANATLTHSTFLMDNAIACYGNCTFCPSLKTMNTLVNSSQPPTTLPTIATICPENPSPICDWIPLKCS